MAASWVCIGSELVSLASGLLWYCSRSADMLLVQVKVPQQQVGVMMVVSEQLGYH